MPLARLCNLYRGLGDIVGMWSCVTIDPYDTVLVVSCYIGQTQVFEIYSQGNLEEYKIRAWVLKRFPLP